MRPPGYEPGELPTAPLRDINHKNIFRFIRYNTLFLNCDCKGTTFYLNYQTFRLLFNKYRYFIGIYYKL